MTKKFTAALLAVVLLICSVCSVGAAPLSTERILGDADNNGKIEVTDATIIQRYLAEIFFLDEESVLASDVDGDGEASIIDCTFVQQFVAKIIDKFPASVDDGTPSEYELEIFRLVNTERAKEGIAPLEFGYFIYDCAKLRAKECDVYFDHTRPDGTSCFTVFRELGVTKRYNTAGENIAWGHVSAEQVMFGEYGWMNSSGHRANIMNPKFKYVAVGSVRCSEYPSAYVTVQIFWG